MQETDRTNGQHTHTLTVDDGVEDNECASSIAAVWLVKLTDVARGGADQN